MASNIILQNPNRHVYKVAAHNHIVTLRIVKGSLTNLDRKVVDILCAGYRGQAMIVVEIEDGKKNKVNKIHSSHDPTFIYEVGATVTVEDYDTDINNIHARGIHFFLTKKRAFYYSLCRMRSYEISDYTGLYKDWYDDGAKLVEYSLVCGKRNGTYTRWVNESIYCTEQYENDILIGESYTWNSNGVLVEYRTFTGTLTKHRTDGEYRTWHDNGKPAEYRFYFNGKLNGLACSWDVSGNLTGACASINKQRLFRMFY